MSTRERFVSTASRLFQQKGFEATSVNEIAEVGELPIGSLYYYFPAGKEELGAAAVRWGAEQFSEVLRGGMASSSVPGEALAACARQLGDRLQASAWRDGCPVATVALEMVHRSPVLREAATTALCSWIDLVADRLVELGVDKARARDLASVTISVLEGAELMARVAGSPEPLATAARYLVALVDMGSEGR